MEKNGVSTPVKFDAAWLVQQMQCLNVRVQRLQQQQHQHHLRVLGDKLNFETLEWRKLRRLLSSGTESKYNKKPYARSIVAVRFYWTKCKLKRWINNSIDNSISSTFLGSSFAFGIDLNVFVGNICAKMTKVFLNGKFEAWRAVKRQYFKIINFYLVVAPKVSSTNHPN